MSTGLRNCDYTNDVKLEFCSYLTFSLSYLHNQYYCIKDNHFQTKIALLESNDLGHSIQCTKFQNLFYYQKLGI